MGKACCFTGHRVISDNEKELYNTVKDEILKLIEDGFDEFRCGGALGFDAMCADAVIEVRKTHPEIRLVFYIPCLDQDKFFNPKQKARYKKQLESGNKILCLSKTYYDGCMLDRNKVMVNGSDLCIAYLRQNRGGTAFTVNYAKRENCPVKIV